MNNAARLISCRNHDGSFRLISYWKTLPLGFSLDEKQLRRAGLDYHQWATIKEYKNLEDYLTQQQPKRLFACTTKGKQCYTEQQYQPGDAFLFGPETRGLPDQVLNTVESSHKIRIPMQQQSRSLNLSNAAAIIVYEAWRQTHFTVEPNVV